MPAASSSAGWSRRKRRRAVGRRREDERQRPHPPAARGRGQRRSAKPGDRGTLASRRGSGTWIRGRSGGSYGDEEALGILARDPYLSSFIDTSSAPIDLTLPAAETRRELVRVAGKLQIPIVEDTVLADLSLDDPPTPLASCAGAQASAVVVGSLSKII